jgi:hypothetical protein
MANGPSLLGTDIGSGMGAPKEGASNQGPSLLSTDIGAPSQGGTQAKPAAGEKDPRFEANRPDAAPMELSEVGSQALQNLPRSAKEFGHAIVQPFLHPVETAESLGKVGTGLYSKAQGALGITQDAGKKAEDEAAVNAIGDFYKQRYGTWENAKRAIAEDPVGVLADASTIFTGGGGLAARLPGTVGKAGEIAGTVGRVTDPLNIALQAPKLATKAATSVVNLPAAIQSGAAYKSLQSAHKAGVTKDPAFWEHYNDPSKGKDLVGTVKSEVSALRNEASDNYVRGMSAEDATRSLGYDLVDKALNEAKNRAYKNIDPRTGIGEGKSPALERTYQALEDAVLGAKTNPNNKNTIIDFDDLKQSLRNYGQDAAKGDRNALDMVSKVANSAKETIMHPDFGRSKGYAEHMENWSDAVNNIGNIEGNLLAGKRDDTKLNKLLKGYKTGKNEDILQQLYQRNPSLAPAIAGYDLSNWLPGGLRGNIVSSMIYGGSGFINPALLLHPGHLAHLAAANALSSPKLMGGVNYAAGRAGALPSDIYKIAPYAPAVSQVGEGMETIDRTKRASGGRISHDSKADALVRAAEMAKKDISKGTEALLDQPDETITRALAVAKKHI